MEPSSSPLFLGFLSFLILSFLHVSASPTNSLGHDKAVGGRRALLSFKETSKGSNVSFDCTPSGACVLCLYSEKKDVQYRCSETGYHIPLKCVEVGGSKNVKSQKSEKSRFAMEVLHEKEAGHDGLHEDAKLSNSITGRSLLADSSQSRDGIEEYISYRSCMPPVDEEKLSVLGFEVVLLCLLLASGSFVYIRKKCSVAPLPGAVRLPTNSRF